MKRKIIILIACVMCTIILTGCFDAKELDELAISLVMGLDLEDDKVLYTAEVIDLQYSSEGSGSVGDVSVKYVQGTGNTVYEALRDIPLKFGRRLYVAHIKAVIFGEDIAKKGLIPYMDLLFRAREQRESAYVIIAKGAKAYEVMGINSGPEPLPANYIVNLIESIESNAKTVDTNMVDFINYYYHMGQHPVTAVLEKNEKMALNQAGQETGTQEFELSSLGSAVFKNDALVGYLNGNDTKALNFLLGNVKNGVITFPTPIEENDTSFSFIVAIRVNTKKDVVLENENITLKAKIKIKGYLGEVQGSIDITKHENMEKMAQACSRAVEEGIKSTVKKVQREFGFDIFGFGHEFHKKYTDEWKEIEGNWDEIFANADFEIEVHTDIISTGILNNPLTVKE